MTPEMNLEVWGTVKVGIAWLGTFVGALTLNGILSTIVLIMTIVFTYYQILKVRRELRALETVKEKA